MCVSLAQCSDELVSPCPEQAAVCFPVPDSTLFSNLKEQRYVNFQSNRGNAQTIENSYRIYTGQQNGLRLEMPDKRPTDDCIDYYADKLRIFSKGNLYPISIHCLLTFDPVNHTASIQVIPMAEDYFYSFYYLDEVVTMSLYDSSFSYTSDMTYRDLPNYQGKATLYRTFANEAGKVFSDVYRFPLRIKLVNKPSVIYPDTFWISKQHGLVQYSTIDGTRWSRKN